MLCDLHVERPGDFQFSYFMQALKEAQTDPPDFIVILGDLTARGEALALKAVADAAKDVSVPTFFLPGNSDIRDSSITTYQRIIGASRFHFSIGEIEFLGIDTSCPRIEPDQREWIAHCLQNTYERRLVLFTHIPPHKLEPDSRVFLEGILSDARLVCCVAGHSHRPEVTSYGCPVYTVGGVDPFKPVPIQPGYDLFTIAEGVRVEHRAITLLSQEQIAAVRCRLGAAPRDFASGQELILFLESHALKHLQLKLSKSISCDLISEIEAWRNRVPDATTSMHLSTPVFDEFGHMTNRSMLEMERDFATDLRVVFVTMHLPKMDSAILQNPSCVLDELSSLLRPLTERGVEIHLENLRWRKEGLEPERCLGVVPSHLIAFHHALLQSLKDIVFFTLDIGHAWGNGELASKYPPYKWFQTLSPLIRSVHLHDTVPSEGKQINHQPLGAKGGMINLEGTFYLLTHLAPEAIVYLEMSNLADIAASLDNIEGWTSNMVHPTTQRYSTH